MLTWSDPSTPYEGGFSLCNEELRRYFDIALTCMEIDLVLSTKPHRHAYEVSRDDFDHIIVEGTSVWVDDELATLIHGYAKGHKKYLSFEYPKGV
jgi:hypothetical protein